jgi:hypothetical protein
MDRTFLRDLSDQVDKRDEKANSDEVIPRQNLPLSPP